MIRMAQTLYPKKSVFIRTCFVVEPIKLWTPILNPVIFIKPVGIIGLDTSQELMRSQLKTLNKHQVTGECRWPTTGQRE